VGLLVGSFLCASFCAYIYTNDYESGVCVARPQTTFIVVYMWLTEMMFNLVAPLATIVLNVLVIRSLLLSRRTRGHELGCIDGGGETQKTSNASTTLMLLSVSFFYVATTLPMTCVYIVHPVFLPGDPNMTDEQVGL